MYQVLTLSHTLAYLKDKLTRHCLIRGGIHAGHFFGHKMCHVGLHIWSRALISTLYVGVSITLVVSAGTGVKRCLHAVSVGVRAGALSRTAPRLTTLSDRPRPAARLTP